MSFSGGWGYPPTYGSASGHFQPRERHPTVDTNNYYLDSSPHSLHHIHRTTRSPIHPPSSNFPGHHPPHNPANTPSSTMMTGPPTQPVTVPSTTRTTTTVHPTCDHRDVPRYFDPRPFDNIAEFEKFFRQDTQPQKNLDGSPWEGFSSRPAKRPIPRTNNHTRLSSSSSSFAPSSSTSTSTYPHRSPYQNRHYHRPKAGYHERHSQGRIHHYPRRHYPHRHPIHSNSHHLHRSSSSPHTRKKHYSFTGSRGKDDFSSSSSSSSDSSSIPFVSLQTNAAGHKSSYCRHNCCEIDPRFTHNPPLISAPPSDSRPTGTTLTTTATTPVTTTSVTTIASSSETIQENIQPSNQSQIDLSSHLSHSSSSSSNSDDPSSNSLEEMSRHSFNKDAPEFVPSHYSYVKHRSRQSRKTAEQKRDEEAQRIQKNQAVQAQMSSNAEAILAQLKQKEMETQRQQQIFQNEVHRHAESSRYQRERINQMNGGGGRGGPEEEKEHENPPPSHSISEFTPDEYLPDEMIQSGIDTKVDDGSPDQLVTEASEEIDEEDLYDGAFTYDEIDALDDAIAQDNPRDHDAGLVQSESMPLPFSDYDRSNPPRPVSIGDLQSGDLICLYHPSMHFWYWGLQFISLIPGLNGQKIIECGYTDPRLQSVVPPPRLQVPSHPWPVIYHTNEKNEPVVTKKE